MRILPSIEQYPEGFFCTCLGSLDVNVSRGGLFGIPPYLLAFEGFTIS